MPKHSGILTVGRATSEAKHTLCLPAHHVCVPGDERKLHQDVWATAVLADGTMVSGDSGGNVQLWDAAHGTLIAGFRQHQADVLALAGSPQADSVFAAGADPQVAVYKRVSAPGATIDLGVYSLSA